MTITPPGDDRPGPIFNTGSGTAIGRDNYGTINAPIDDTTRKLLAKLAGEAPDLARLFAGRSTKASSHPASSTPWRGPPGPSTKTSPS
jgi:hypothetical protein